MSMPGEITQRKPKKLSVVAEEFNVSTSRIIEIIKQATGEELRNDPNLRIKPEFYEVLLKFLGNERKKKQEQESHAREMQLQRQAYKQPKKEQDEQDLPLDLDLDFTEPSKEQEEEASSVEPPIRLRKKGKVDLEAILGQATPKKKTSTTKKASLEETKEVEEVKKEEPEKKVEVEKIEASEVSEAVEEKKEEVQQETVVEQETATEEVVPEAEVAEESEPKVQPEEELQQPQLKVKGVVDLSSYEKDLRAKELRKKLKQRLSEAKKTATRIERKREKEQLRAKREKPKVKPPKKRKERRRERQKLKQQQEKAAAQAVKQTLTSLQRRSKLRQKLRKKKREEKQQKQQAQEVQQNILEVTEFLTVGELADLMGVEATDVIAKCMALGYFVSINQRIDKDLIETIAEEYGYEVRFVSIEETYKEQEEEEVDESALEPRPPIVTVMGHVDHGKTSLLDYIRNTNVVAGEAGGITQHIGAYMVTLEDGRKITFIDTPGHEAFTAMRARGAQVTDIAVIVIAADDQVMPQTKEAIQHAQAAGVSMIFAINKIDKPEANPDRIRQQLAEMNILVEEWGGPYQCQEISAKTGQGIPELIEKILLEAELLELKANPNRRAKGVVLEAKMDPGRGPVATFLVQDGTLKERDVVLTGCYYGRARALLDERGNRVKSAGPSTPVQVLGLNGIPEAGDHFSVLESEREAREIATKRAQVLREQQLRRTQQAPTLEQLSEKSKTGDFKELRLIVKADVQGSVEAILDTLHKLSTDEITIKVVMHGVGQISESDVLLAVASKAIIIGFNVRPHIKARKLAEKEGVEIRNYKVIYDLVNDIKQAMEGLLEPEYKEEILGVAEVRKTFKISKVGTVAGCMVIDGVVKRGFPVRVVRDGVEIYDGKIASLKRFKDDVKEVSKGYECGIAIENFNDIKEGDIIECYQQVAVKRTLETIKEE